MTPYTAQDLYAGALEKYVETRSPSKYWAVNLKKAIPSSSIPVSKD